MFLQDGAVHLEQICDPEVSISGNRFNDGKVDSALVDFWAGTMDDSERDTTGAWWRLNGNGECTKIDAGFKITNGPAFDQRRLRAYLTDSANRTIYVAEFDGEKIEKKREFRRFTESYGYPDGMEVDREGCLWAAFWDGGCIRRFSPDGEELQVIELDIPRPTSISIVADKIYVTSARIGLEPAQIEAFPNSGGLFEIQLARPIGAAHISLFAGGSHTR